MDVKGLAIGRFRFQLENLLANIDPCKGSRNRARDESCHRNRIRRRRLSSVVESRGIDVCHEDLQIFAEVIEVELGKPREH